MSGAGAPPGGEAAARVCTAPPDFDRTMGDPVPVFLRPSIKEYMPIAIGRLLRHPVLGRRAWKATGSLKSALAVTLWRETAAWFGYETVRFDDQSAIRVTEILPPTRRRPPSAGSAEDITGVLIARNEADLIERALDSLRPWVGRLLVVDGGSTDDTVAIALRAGAEVIERRFDDDFGAQRNAALAHVRTPWVLTIDCDETIPAELGAILVEYACHGDADGLMLPRLNLVGTDPQPTLFPDLHARLFRSHLRYHGRLHERVHPRTRAYLPLNGPQLQHHKSAVRHYRNQLFYERIEPGALSANEVAELKATLDRLTPEGSPPETPH